MQFKNYLKIFFEFYQQTYFNINKIILKDLIAKSRNYDSPTLRRNHRLVPKASKQPYSIPDDVLYKNGSWNWNQTFQKVLHCFRQLVIFHKNLDFIKRFSGKYVTMTVMLFLSLGLFHEGYFVLGLIFESLVPSLIESTKCVSLLPGHYGTFLIFELLWQISQTSLSFLSWLCLKGNQTC